MTDKDKYRILCKEETSIPFFSKDWWLDAVAGSLNWDVAIIEKNGKIIASLPFVLKNKLFFVKIISQPPFTQTLGPWISYKNITSSRKLSLEKEVTNLLISKLPNHLFFNQNFHFSFTNLTSFIWNDFNPQVRYTYRINDLTNLDLIWNNFRENIKSDIKKATKKYNLKIKEEPFIDEFIELNKQVFERKNIKSPHNYILLKKIFEISKKYNAVKLFIAEDSLGKVHAGLFLVWDNNSAYYLLSGSNPSLRNSGAMSFCLWEAIKFSASVTSSFDFEGSMIEPIDKYFRAFGADQKMYFNVQKNNLLNSIRTYFK